MTTANTNRALKATQTIEQLGGLQRAEWGTSPVDANDLLKVLNLFSRLKLDVPKELADVLTETATICQRAHKLKTAPAVYSADDLAAEDYEQRFTEVMTGQLRVLAKADTLISQAKATVVSRAVAVIRQQAQPLIKLLNRAYRANPTAEIREVHRSILLSWVGGMAPRRLANDYTARWCLTWAWTPEAWNKLADDTAAQMEVPSSWRGSEFDFAIACGGKPYLAPSTTDAADRAARHYEQRQLWKDSQLNAVAQERAREEMARQVAQAEAEQERAIADARRRAAVTAAAEAD